MKLKCTPLVIVEEVEGVVLLAAAVPNIPKMKRNEKNSVGPYNILKLGKSIRIHCHGKV